MDPPKQAHNWEGWPAALSYNTTKWLNTQAVSPGGQSLHPGDAVLYHGNFGKLLSLCELQLPLPQNVYNINLIGLFWG